MNANISMGRLWVARIMKGLVIIFMLLDGITKLIKTDHVVESTLVLGYTEHILL